MSPNPQGDIEYTCTQGFIMLEKSPERNPVQHLKPKKKAFNCETCDFKSQKKYNLEVHMKNKHESTPKRSTDRLFCRVLPTSTVTTCSFNPVVTIITMFPSNVSSIACLRRGIVTPFAFI